MPAVLQRNLLFIALWCYEMGEDRFGDKIELDASARLSI